MVFKPLSLLILKFRNRSVAVVRDRCTVYSEFVSVAQSTFPPLQNQDIVFLASIPGYPVMDQVELSEPVWEAIRDTVPSVTVALQSELQFSALSPFPNPVLPKIGTPLMGPPPNLPVVLGAPLPSPLTNPVPARRNVDIADIKVRKPIVYLFPPNSLPHVTVELLLTSCWGFSAVYPRPLAIIPPGEHRPAQSLTWSIAAEPDGTLIDKSTGTEVSYLFWEAAVNSHLITPEASRATTPIEDIETFDPSRPSVSPGNSILLPIGKVVGYLDVALKALALHTDARTSFITYWLPDLLKHEYLALRFLAQASYEKAAQMRVLPAPDVVTRVFMLFRGVAPGDLGLWTQAAERAAAEDGATFWAQVVGVDAARASDRGLFRVLEWGGMEVK